MVGALPVRRHAGAEVYLPDTFFVADYGRDREPGSIVRGSLRHFILPEIAPIPVGTDHGEDRLRSGQRVRSEAEADTRDGRGELDACVRRIERDPVLRRRIGVADQRSAAVPSCREADRGLIGWLRLGKLWLIDDRIIPDLQSGITTVWADPQGGIRDEGRPVEAVWEDGLVEAVDLVAPGGQTHRAREQIESQMGQRASLACSALRDELALHEADIGSRPAELERLTGVVPAGPG